MKILFFMFLILTIPVQNAILKQQQSKHLTRKLYSYTESRNLSCASNTQLFTLIYVALLMFLFLGNQPKWALLLISIPFVLTLVRSMFHEIHHGRKLSISKLGRPIFTKKIRKLAKKGFTMDRENKKVMKFLKKRGLMKNRKLSKHDFVKVVQDYYNTVNKMHGEKLLDQIKFVVGKIYDNKSNIMSLLRTMM
jgi:hypothetical protein